MIQWGIERELRGGKLKEFTKTKQLQRRERGDGGRSGLNLNISSLSCFGPIVIAWRSPLLHRKEWIWHQRSWAWQCQEVCLTVCKYLCVSMLPLLAHGAAHCSLAFSLELALSAWGCSGRKMVIYMPHFPDNSPTTVSANYSGVILSWPYSDWASLVRVLLRADWNAGLFSFFLFLNMFCMLSCMTYFHHLTYNSPTSSLTPLLTHSLPPRNAKRSSCCPHGRLKRHPGSSSRPNVSASDLASYSDRYYRQSLASASDEKQKSQEERTKSRKTLFSISIYKNYDKG